MDNSVVVFSFSVLEQQYPFWTNLVQTYASLSLNLVPSLFEYAQFNDSVHLLPPFHRNFFFFFE